MLQGIVQNSSNVQLFSDCRDVVDTGFSFAFQPIVDLNTLEIHGHEALVRGLSGESAASVIDAIRPENQFFFDQACRMRALQVASRLGIREPIHLNCSHVRPENLALTITTTRECAEEHGIDPSQVVLEFGQLEPLGNPRELHAVRVEAEKVGFRVLADNFGANEVGLKRLVVFKPHYAKIDRSLISGIEASVRRQALVSGILATCRLLGVTVIAGGVERKEELNWLTNAGVDFAQGYLFARPTFESAPRVRMERFAA